MPKKRIPLSGEAAELVDDLLEFVRQELKSRAQDQALKDGAKELTKATFHAIIPATLHNAVTKFVPSDQL